MREDTLTFRYNDLDSLEDVLNRNKGQVACIIMMPLEIIPPEPGFLEGVKRLAHEHGAVFILDEMRSGFRMSLGGAQEYYRRYARSGDVQQGHGERLRDLGPGGTSRHHDGPAANPTYRPRSSPIRSPWRLLWRTSSG